jgi:replicative DNA helicase
MLKIPPHNIEAEQAVLWSILIDKEGLIVVWDKIKKEDFYEEIHGDIYEALVDLYEKHKPIDIVTLSNYLKNKNLFDKVWGNPYIIELTNIVPTSSNIWEYAEIVKNKSVLRKLALAGNVILKHSYDEDTKLSELLEKAEKELFDVTQTFVDNKLTHIKEIVEKRYNEIAEISEHPEIINKYNVKVGYSGLDDKLWGLKPWDLSILAARPAMGKTAFALNIARNIWISEKEDEKWNKLKKSVAIFSLEMSKEQLTDRMIAASVWINSWKLAKWELEDEEFSKVWDAMNELSKINIFIDDSAWWNLMDIKSKARRLKIQHWIDIIIIDYLQLMSNWNSLNRVQEISEISRGLKSLARELGIPVIALSQLSRAVENRTDKRPILSDLRESGSIEQDADSVLMLYRDDYYQEDSWTFEQADPNDMDKKTEWLTTVFIRKNRSGPVWSVDLKFEKKFQKFVEIDNTHDQNYM